MRRYTGDAINERAGFKPNEEKQNTIPMYFYFLRSARNHLIRLPQDPAYWIVNDDGTKIIKPNLGWKI